ncbi:MAG TPA: hypothetical protein PK034_11675 [Rugosibacter sp.]|nr:hypothetical protein [Rugosibacter sp.]
MEKRDIEHFGNKAKIGDRGKIGKNATIGDRATIGNLASIGDGTKIGNFATIGNWAMIGRRSTIGDWASIGDCATIGDGAKIGYRATIGDGPEFGGAVTFGQRLTCEGVKVIRMMTMSNVDGSGRRLHIYVHTKGIFVRAGCFCGSLDEFCKRAEEEGKVIYSSVVRAAAEALAAKVKELGLDGGWGDENA